MVHTHTHTHTHIVARQAFQFQDGCRSSTPCGPNLPEQGPNWVNSGRVVADSWRTSQVLVGHGATYAVSGPMLVPIGQCRARVDWPNLSHFLTLPGLVWSMLEFRRLYAPIGQDLADSVHELVVPANFRPRMAEFGPSLVHPKPKLVELDEFEGSWPDAWQKPG